MRDENDRITTSPEIMSRKSDVIPTRVSVYFVRELLSKVGASRTFQGGLFKKVFIIN